MPVILAVVTGKMLYAGNDRVGGDTLDVSSCHLPAQIRVLTIILEVSPTHRDPGQVHPRPQEHSHSQSPALLTQYGAYALKQLTIEARCQC
ncbi:hypothetical protein SDC9_210429 [bioreactor metagenome]|uniref:Uncharacterized protein n=1 Tax=bioreactor metagenome TaxID=1076179 RepID=A0A645JGV4_9ZZZZ